jgi:hypothetical protein
MLRNAMFQRKLHDLRDAAVLRVDVDWRWKDNNCESGYDVARLTRACWLSIPDELRGCDVVDREWSARDIAPMTPNILNRNTYLMVCKGAETMDSR